MRTVYHDDIYIRKHHASHGTGVLLRSETNVALEGDAGQWLSKYLLDFAVGKVVRVGFYTKGRTRRFIKGDIKEIPPGPYAEQIAIMKSKFRREYAPSKSFRIERYSSDDYASQREFMREEIGTRIVGDCEVPCEETGLDIDCYWDITWHGKRTRAHRASLEEKLGRPVADDLSALHTRECKFKSCIAEAHMYEGTQQENNADWAALATKSANAMGVGKHELVDIIRAIRTACIEGMSFSAVAKAFELSGKFDFSVKVIDEIVHGKRFGKVTYADGSPYDPFEAGFMTTYTNAAGEVVEKSMGALDAIWSVREEFTDCMDLDLSRTKRISVVASRTNYSAVMVRAILDGRQYGDVPNRDGAHYDPHGHGFSYKPDIKHANRKGVRHVSKYVARNVRAARDMALAGAYADDIVTSLGISKTQMWCYLKMLTYPDVAREDGTLYEPIEPKYR